jgi:hypothetical protein
MVCALTSFAHSTKILQRPAWWLVRRGTASAAAHQLPR